MSYKACVATAIRLSFVTALLLGLRIGLLAQQPQSQLPGVSQSGNSGDSWSAQQQKEMGKKLNLQRQEEIKKDTDKLLKLATELKQSVDKTTENTLSLDVIKKAEEIEKLAKNVKEKMKGP